MLQESPSLYNHNIMGQSKKRRYILMFATKLRVAVKAVDLQLSILQSSLE